MRKAGFITLFVLSVGVAAYAVIGYSLAPLGALVHPDMKADFIAHPAGLYAHVFSAAFALLLGPLQFSTALRRKYPKLHRWLGRLYLSLGVLIGGMSGLYIAQFAYGGWVARTGFAALSLCWLITGWFAYRAIRRGAVAEHKKWMVRNFALAFAAVMLRIYVPLFVIAGVPFATAYPIIAWLCWVPTVLVAEWWWNERVRTPTKIGSMPLKE
jgi:uncharacterized membrane protein